MVLMGVVLFSNRSFSHTHTHTHTQIKIDIGVKHLSLPISERDDDAHSKRVSSVPPSPSFPASLSHPPTHPHTHTHTHTPSSHP